MGGVTHRVAVWERDKVLHFLARDALGNQHKASLDFTEAGPARLAVCTAPRPPTRDPHTARPAPRHAHPVPLAPVRSSA